ncbi:MAG: Nuclear control of ATPase protein 2 [Caeruleum heppii]|nr:MAG: Nuclear control of ATPase protein 2 [Caeruleum heppii]
MSLVTDQVRRIDAQLDRFLLSSVAAEELAASDTGSRTVSTTGKIDQTLFPEDAVKLQTIIKTLSTASSSRVLLRPHAISHLLEQATEATSSLPIQQGDRPNAQAFQQKLQWLVLGKAAAQTYGLVLGGLLEQTIPLSDDIWYWDDVLGSYTYTALYSLQTSPLRLWHWSKDIYHEARARLESLHLPRADAESASTEFPDKSRRQLSLTENWREFYGLVKQTIQSRSMSDVQRRVVAPFVLSRSEAKRKQNGLKRIRELSASGLGVLMDEGLSFDVEDDSTLVSKDRSRGNDKPMEKEEWKVVLEKSVTLVETVLDKVANMDLNSSDFEDMVFASVDEDSDPAQQSTADVGGAVSRPAKLSKRIRQILGHHVPRQAEQSRALVTLHGRPSRLIRYWIPAMLLLISSTTILRVLAKRRAAILAWIKDLGSTAIDFWNNWVLEPTKKVIGTIRHDKDSEIAIMSQRSLEGDRASLERMVVDFAIDHPEPTTGRPLQEAGVAEIRAKVKEGDLTPVLRAYENDLKRPFVGTVRGDLIRALLIQIQKTKVDVEVAMGGIDALLKSQELVFGFVGLTPGILVCFAATRWLGTALGRRKGTHEGKNQGHTIRLLRNVDRTLSMSTRDNNGMLSYKEHGLLLCDVHVLRQHASGILPRQVLREFLEDIQDLVDIRAGVKRQLGVVERIRWTYARWIK